MTAGAIEFRTLESVEPGQIIALMNHPLLARHMPLLKTPFTESDYRGFLAAKQRLWDEHGYGPRAILVAGQFAGWGGLQPEAGEADLALVLHPQYWGHGPAIMRMIIAEGFGVMGLESMIALLPLSRTRERGMQRLGFVRDGDVELSGVRFRRYRLTAEVAADPTTTP